jgi:hypothetical protein
MYLVAEAVETEGEANWLRRGGGWLPAGLSFRRADGDAGFPRVSPRAAQSEGVVTRPDLSVDADCTKLRR